MGPHIISHALLLPSETQTKMTEPARVPGLKATAQDESNVNSIQPEEDHKVDTKNDSSNTNSEEYKLQLVWRNVIIFAVLHSVLLYSLYLTFTFKLKFGTYLFIYVYAVFGGFGITAGAHRLWAHRSYTAKLPLRIFLMLAQSAALQNDIHEWVLYANTPLCVGWLMCKKHKDVMDKGKTVDMSDVLKDPVVRFQRKYYIPLVLTMTLALPTFIPWYFFGEDGWYSFIVCIGRYVTSLNGTWLVNSAAHIWGMRPYDRNINPTENKFVAVVAFGEGWHNYHHIFPWDYKAAELGNYNWNFTTCFLDIMARIGWATDLKTASEEIIKKRALRTGDGSWSNQNAGKTNKSSSNGHHHHHQDGELIWGWGDKDMNQEEVNAIRRMNRQKA